METSPAPWIEALRHSHDNLQSTVAQLDPSDLERRSYASEWSIAQVLSHLGSQAEIFQLFLDAALSGQDPPGMEVFGAIWDRWNAKSPRAQAADALAADAAVTERFESLDTVQRERLRLKAFGRELDATGLARLRLGEHAVHTWDIAVALDPAARVAPDAVDLIVDTLGDLVSRAAKPDEYARPHGVRVSTTSPQRHFVLDIDENVTLEPASGQDGQPELVLPAEAFVRLVYGRLGPDHTPPVETSGVDLDELRRLFPGF